jgi:hypothetical protein
VLEAGDDPFHGCFEVAQGDRVGVAARGEQRRLVDDVGQVGATEAGRQSRGAFEVEVCRQRDRACVDAENLHAPDEIGVAQRDLSIEPAGAQQRGVENLRTICGRYDDDRLGGVGLETVDLGKQLVERLLALVVGHHDADGARPALTDRVDLVDENNGRSSAARLVEQIAHARRADADEHLDEFRPAGLEEGHLRFAGGRLGNERFAGAGRPDQQHALRDPSPEACELLRRLQELDDLAQLRDRFVGAADVLERHADIGRPHFGRLALADTENAAGAGAPVRGVPKAAEEQHRQQER